MKKKSFYLLLIGLTALTVLTGCRHQENDDTETVTSESLKIQIGFTLDSKVLERWVRDVEVFTSTAHQLGAEVDVQTANGDIQTQIEQIENFIELKKDVIAIVAIDLDALSDTVQKAVDAGIKIVCYDRLINHVPADLYISFDNYQVGCLMGRTMAAEVPEGGKVMMICGPKSDLNAAQVEAGFLDAIEGSNIEVIQVNYAKGWLPEYAFETINTAFQGIDDIDGVMCGNDGLAVQAIRALAEKRLAGKVCVVGQDADVEACQKVVEGMQTMTVYKDINSLAKQAAEYAVMLAQNIPLTDVTDYVDNGGQKVPQKLLEPIAVTVENIDEIIVESNFHVREEVYLNVEADEEVTAEVEIP